MTRHVGLVVWLTAVWTGLWGDLSWANLLGGLAVAVVLVVLLPLPHVPREGTVQPLRLVQLVVVFGWELVKASASVTVQVLRPGPLRPAVLAVPVPGLSDRLVTLLANAVSLTPGTLALEVDRPRATLYVHALHVPDRPGALDDVRRSIGRLQTLAVRALGSAEARAHLEAARR